MCLVLVVTYVFEMYAYDWGKHMEREVYYKHYNMLVPCRLGVVATIRSEGRVAKA